MVRYGETTPCKLRKVLVFSPPICYILSCVATPWNVVYDKARQGTLLLVELNWCILGTCRHGELYPWELLIPHFQRYWLVGGLIWSFERILREVRSRHKTYISKVIQHPSKVVELQIKKEKISIRAGQYIFICCPAISYFQWHPFTLTR